MFSGGIGKGAKKCFLLGAGAASGTVQMSPTRHPPSRFLDLLFFRSRRAFSICFFLVPLMSMIFQCSHRARASKCWADLARRSISCIESARRRGLVMKSCSCGAAERCDGRTGSQSPSYAASRRIRWGLPGRYGVACPQSISRQSERSRPCPRVPHEFLREFHSSRHVGV